MTNETPLNMHYWRGFDYKLYAILKVEKWVNEREVRGILRIPNDFKIYGYPNPISNYFRIHYMKNSNHLTQTLIEYKAIRDHANCRSSNSDYVTYEGSAYVFKFYDKAILEEDVYYWNHRIIETNLEIHNIKD
jgi:hypothetical protein